MFQHANNTLNQGGIGLARAIYEYQRLGYTVCLPLVDAQDYDLVIEKDGKWESVQCKTTSVKATSKQGNVIDGRYEISLRTVKTNTRETVVKNKGNFDLLFAMCDNGDCYSIPHKELPQSGTTLGGPKYAKYKIGC